jgi:cell pole-organizing protein PopZ
MTSMPAAAFRTIDGQSDVVFTEPPPPEPEIEHPLPQDDRLLSGSTSVAVDSAFNSLAQTVLLRNARTLEDVVREMLRPMLKTWLDDNLPGLVERLVRAEIERVSRGRS